MIHGTHGHTIIKGASYDLHWFIDWFGVCVLCAADHLVTHLLNTLFITCRMCKKFLEAELRSVSFVI